MIKHAERITDLVLLDLIYFIDLSLGELSESRSCCTCVVVVADYSTTDVDAPYSVHTCTRSDRTAEHITSNFD